MQNKTKETMDILTEEAAEVIQALSKCSRFGLEGKKPDSHQTNREHLEEELGDLLAMIDILVDFNIVNVHNIELAKSAKIEKLRRWSTIFDA